LQKFVEHPSHKLVSIVQSLHDPHSAQRTRVTMDPKTGKIQLDQTTVVRSPWASGSFYLFCVVAFILTLRIAFGQLHPIWLPVVLVGGVIVSVVVGALQLKQDSRLSERGFLSLISVAFRSLPLVRSLVPSTAKRRKPVRRVIGRLRREELLRRRWVRVSCECGRHPSNKRRGRSEGSSRARRRQWPDRRK
jgi:hypothetical protein